MVQNVQHQNAKPKERSVHGGGEDVHERMTESEKAVDMFAFSSLERYDTFLPKMCYLC